MSCRFRARLVGPLPATEVRDLLARVAEGITAAGQARGELNRLAQHPTDITPVSDAIDLAGGPAHLTPGLGRSRVQPAGR